MTAKNKLGCIARPTIFIMYDSSLYDKGSYFLQETPIFYLPIDNFIINPQNNEIVGRMDAGAVFYLPIDNFIICSYNLGR